jgi:hypothetical protein
MKRAFWDLSFFVDLAFLFLIRARPGYPLDRVPQSQQNQAVISENASPYICHPDAQRKDLQLYWFAKASLSGEAQDADLHEVSYFTFVVASRSRIEWTPEKQLRILPLRVRMTAVAPVNSCS